MVETGLLIVVVQACMFAMLSLGYLVGKRAAKPESKPAETAPSQERKEPRELTQAEKNKIKFMEEQMEAFHMLMNYNADNAYGVVPLSVEGGEKI